MMNKTMKIVMAFAMVSFGIYFWCNYQSFKIFKSEKGATWSATENPYGAVHHK